jgi:hypothetical protein
MLALVGRPILAAAGFSRPYLARSIKQKPPEGGCSQDWLPHVSIKNYLDDVTS